MYMNAPIEKEEMSRGQEQVSIFLSLPHKPSSFFVAP